MHWRKRIKDLRIDHDMTKKHLAKLTDVSEKTIARYENGDSEPSISFLIKLSLIFNVSVDYICGITDQEIVVTPSIKDELLDVSQKLDKISKKL